MKKAAVLFFALLLGSCSETTSSFERKMVVSPKQLVFSQGENLKPLSVTHTCTCPFTWIIYASDSSGVFKTINGSSDHSALQISIDRSKLTIDTTRMWLYVNSNYGLDSVDVTIYR
jgi:hypothetical protein